MLKVATVDKLAKFVADYGEKATEYILQTIVEAFANYGEKGGDGVRFSTVHQLNACNHVLVGHVEHDGTEWHFIIEVGDWNGTLVRDFGTVDEVSTYEPPVPTRFTFVPSNDNLKMDHPEMYKVYLWWREQPWFTEQIQKYQYDRHFQPGGAIEKHYSDWAAAKGLKIVALPWGDFK